MNYEIGHIYKIVCNINNSFCYIGSTFLSLDKRWQGHIKDYKINYGTISIHKYFDKYGIENFKIVLIKSYKVVRVDNKDFKHLCAYETLHINKNKKIAVNLLLPYTPMRYLNEKEYKKKYRENNKSIINEKAKKYKKKNQHKIKKYYEENKDKLNEKFNCECGGKYIKQSISRHLKTKIHIKYIENKICNNATMQ
jgi:hypothetical protein